MEISHVQVTSNKIFFHILTHQLEIGFILMLLIHFTEPLYFHATWFLSCKYAKFVFYADSSTSHLLLDRWQAVESTGGQNKRSSEERFNVRMIRNYRRSRLSRFSGKTLLCWSSEKPFRRHSRAPGYHNNAWEISALDSQILYWRILTTERNGPFRECVVSFCTMVTVEPNII